MTTERTFRKSTAHTHVHYDMTKNPNKVETLEKCSLCEQQMFDGAMCLRNDQTKNAICVLCMVGIAEVV